MNGIRFTFAAGAAAAIALASFSAHADEESGLSVGVRTGYAIPMGNSYKANNVPGFTDTTLASFHGGMQPFWFDLGYRINRNLYVGAFYQFGITRPPVAYCGPGVSCDGSDQRFGIDAHYHIRPTELLDPWVGLGLGYETSRVNRELPSGTESSVIGSGFQADLQLGLDLRLAKRVPFGPYIDFSMAKYSSFSVRDQNSNSTSVGLDGGLHEWLTLGVRVQFNL